MANTQNIYNGIINQGATWNLAVEWQDNNGQPIDLTGYTAKMQLRTSPMADIADVTLTSAPNGGIIIVPLTGTLNLTITAAQTAQLKPQRYTYDLEVTLPQTGFVARLIQGVMNVSAETTR